MSVLKDGFYSFLSLPFYVHLMAAQQDWRTDTSEYYHF